MNNPNNLVRMEHGEIVHRRRYTTWDVVEIAGLSPDIICFLVEWDVVHPLSGNRPEEFRFDETALSKVLRAARLHHEMGIHWRNMDVVLHLIERIEGLERDIARLRQRLG